MRKIAVGLLVIMLAVVSVYAAMDDVQVSTGALVPDAAKTNNVVIRGKLAAVYVSAPTWASGSTNTVTITCDGQTVFTKAFTANAMYYPRIASHDTTGTAITFVGGTNNAANTWYTEIPVAGTVTIVQTAGKLGTNSYTAKLVIEK